MSPNHKLTFNKWWEQVWCWHKPNRVAEGYYDYTCEKCGFVHDKGYYAPKLRDWWWFVTGRVD